MAEATTFVAGMTADLNILGTVEQLQHRVLNVWQVGEVIFCRGEVTYTLAQRRPVTIPFCNYLKWTEIKYGNI